MMFIEKNIYYVLSGLFLIIGIPFAVVSIFEFKNTLNLLSNSHKTLGKIVGIEEERREKGGYMYSPVIKYKLNNGDEYVYHSSTKTEGTSYKIGQEIELIYDKNNPQNSRVNTFLDIWFLSIIMGIGGWASTIAGIVLLFVTLKKKRQVNHLMKNGQRITVEFVSVSRGNISINEESSYIINSQWQNPLDNILYVFKSDDIWFDPTNYVKDKKIEVLIDPKDPKKYYVDLSFLPKNL